jgi:MFS-type transporter involved in bile tolerance (Atg22 family)
MISLLWSPESGAGAVFSIAVTFVTVYLEMSAQQVAYITLILLASNIPGSLVAKWACQRSNPLFSYRAGLLSFAGSIAAASAVLTGPERRNLAYLFASLWGMTLGWMYPSQRVLFCTLIPKKQETELMGLFVFCGNLIGWLPPLIFTIMNEQNVDMRWGLSIYAFFSALAFVCTLPMGKYTHAVAQVSVTDETEDLDVSKAQS